MNYRTLILFAPLALFLSVGVAASSFYQVSPYREPGHLAVLPPRVDQLAEGKSIALPPFSLAASHRVSGGFRILDKDTHSLGYDSQLAPYDFLVGWGKMSNIKILPQFSFLLGGRHFSWKVEDLPFSASEIQSSLALFSMIPADRRIAQRLAGLRRYDVVSLEGYVVSAHHQDGWSLAGRVPTDADNQSKSFILYLERLAVGELIPQAEDPFADGFIFKRQKTQPLSGKP